MAAAKNGNEQYSDVVQRLQTLVEQLEGGGLSLEDSLEKFAEGIQLVRKGEKLLSEAEKRIEQLLSDDGNKIVPLCFPYANGNCVHYLVYSGTPGV